MTSLVLDPFPHHIGYEIGEVFQPERGGFQLSDITCEAWEPPKAIRSWNWICENVHTHKGAPFNYVDFPWVEGICDSWDDPFVRRLFFMAGSRLGKTETFLSLMQCAQYRDPDVGMIAGSTENLIMRTIGDRFYAMLEKTHATRHLCPPPHRRNRKTVRTRSFSIYGAWSGSPTTLGDLDPRYLQALELDKWTKNTSEEADPAELFFERGAEIPDRKLAAESTPTIEGMSRIKKYFMMGTQKRYHVPCPQCGFHQVLHRNTTGDKKDGGLIWHKPKDGKVIPSIAAETAQYICERCNEEIREEHRRSIIRKGVWAGLGQQVTDDGKVIGKLVNAGPDESFHISRLYGPTFTFADYARNYVRAEDDPEMARSFVNNWDGDTWIPIQVQMTWMELAEKLCKGKYDLGIVPENGIFVTSSIDVQVDHFVATAFAWDCNQSGHLISYGILHEWDDVRNWCYRLYEHSDGGNDVPSFVNLIDSRDGNRKDEIVDFCMSTNKTKGPFIWPSMGSRPGTLNLQLFRKTRIDHEGRTGKKATGKSIEGMYLVMINTTYTQEWLDNAISRRQPGDPLSLTFPESIDDDRDFFSQILNERFNPEKGTWVRVDESVPVDFRDSIRYARAAAEVYVNGNWSRVPVKRIKTVKTREQRINRQERVAEKANRVPRAIAKKATTGRKFIRRRGS